MSLNIHAAFLCSFQHKPISFSFSSQNSHSPRHSFPTHPPPTTARLSAFVPFVPFIHSCRLLLVTIEWLWTELLYYCKQRKAESSSSLLMGVKNLNDFRFFFLLLSHSCLSSFSSSSSSLYVSCLATVSYDAFSFYLKLSVSLQLLLPLIFFV